MILPRHFFISIIIVVKLNYVIGKTSKDDNINAMDWKIVETLAEEHPYVVGLLNATLDYMCTGIIVNKRTVLTSGSCISPALHYIAVGSAVLSRSINKRNLFEIANTALHADYAFELKKPDPNVTRMHSNIGLVFSVKPDLEDYNPVADLGNYYAPELQQKDFRVIGFGNVNNASKIAVLQQQIYHQSACTNPKWYYCVCGFEFTGPSRTYINEFGQGAPVVLNSEVVGVAAAPCGSLVLRNKVEYNIFTILGPYLPWIDKRSNNNTVRFRTTSYAPVQSLLHPVCVLLVIITKVLFH